MNKFPKQEIENLLKRVKNDDPSALDRLIELKEGNLLKLAYTYLHDKMLAEDVVSEVFYEFLKRIKQFKNEKNLNGWLNVTTINKSLNIIKKRKKEVFTEDCKSPEHFYDENNAEQIHINDCLAHLDEDERKALFCQDYGYTLKETAKIMDLTINELRGLLERAKKKFIEIYNKN